MKGTIIAFSSKALFFAHSAAGSALVDVWECASNRKLFQFRPPTESHQHVTSLVFNHVTFVDCCWFISSTTNRAAR